jgi:phenylpyruvate C(3)-methyltransferase
MTVLPDALSADERYCADTFNGAVASAALSAAWEAGLLDELERARFLDAHAFAAGNAAHLNTLNAVLLALASRDIVAFDREKMHATPGPGFEEALRARGFFYWLTAGCAELFAGLPRLVRDPQRAQGGVRRDARAISIACRTIARSFFDPPFLDLIAQAPIGVVADLGCGSGDRIVMLAGHRPGLRAVGVDIAADAIAVATEAVEQAGYGDRITLVRDDVLALAAKPEYEHVDTLTCFLMGHDFWPRENCLKTLRRLREVFPNARNLILGDTCRSTGVPATGLPMFTLGFETAHAVMDTYLPTLAEWDALLEESDWEVVDRRMVDFPAFSFVYRLAPR